MTNGRLLAFGCSNTLGNGLELEPSNNYRHLYKPSKYAWPQVLANMLDRQCINRANSGASNRQITYTILNTEFQSDDIVIIMWTYFDRHCVFLRPWSKEEVLVKPIINRTETSTGPAMFTLTPGFAIGENRRKKEKKRKFPNLSKIYFKYLFNLYDAKYEYWKSMNLIDYHLKDKVKYVKHLTTNSGGLLDLPIWNVVPLFPTDFHQYTVKYGFGYDDMHPGVIAHKTLAEDLYNELLSSITNVS